MLDLKALLLKLVQLWGSDVAVSHPLDTQWTETPSRAPTATTLNNILRADDNVKLSYASLENITYYSHKPRLLKVGRCLDDTNATWAWKITSLNDCHAIQTTPLSESDREVVSQGIFPLERYDAIADVKSSTSATDWELVEVFVKFPKRSYNRTTGLQTEVAGYSTNTPSGTSSSILYARSAWTYYFPFPATFFNGVVPPPAITGMMENTASATMRCLVEPIEAEDTGLWRYTLRLFSQATKSTTASTSYDYYVFAYMFFTRHKVPETIELDAYYDSDLGMIILETNPPTNGGTLYMYNNWHGPSSSDRTWNSRVTMSGNGQGEYEVVPDYTSGTTILTSKADAIAGTTNYPTAPHWYITVPMSGTHVKQTVPYDYYVNPYAVLPY